MNGTGLAELIIASTAVLGMVGSLLALAYRQGILTGTVLTFMRQSEGARTETMKAIGALEERMLRHVEQHHGRV